MNACLELGDQGQTFISQFLVKTHAKLAFDLRNQYVLQCPNGLVKGPSISHTTFDTILVNPPGLRNFVVVHEKTRRAFRDNS